MTEDSPQQRKSTPRTIITLTCGGCDALEETAILEHAEDTKQVQKVASAHRSMARAHEVGCPGPATVEMEEKRAN